MGRQLGRDARLGLSHTEIMEFTLNMESINQTSAGTVVSCKGLHGNSSVWEFGPGKQDFGDALREVLPVLDPVLAMCQGLLRATRQGVRLRNSAGAAGTRCLECSGHMAFSGATAVRVNVRNSNGNI